MTATTPEDAESVREDAIDRAPAPETAEPIEGVAATPVARRGLLTIGVMAATLIQVLDSTIANVALPHMQSSLGATADTITWVLTSYIVASAVAIPITGWLSDRIGSRTLFLISTGGFVVASMLCGMAGSLPAMVAFRVLQGIFAAFLNPLSQTVLLDINKPADQGKAMSVWGMGIMVGPILGPILGGWLTDNYDWRWVFYVNLPVGGVAFAILYFLLPTRPVRAREFDLFGFSMLAVGIASLQLMLDRGQTQDWFQSWEVMLEGAVALITFWIFIVHIFMGRNPMFERDMLRNGNLLTSIGFMFVLGVVMMATMALLPPMLQRLFGYSVLETGVLLMPRGVGVLISMFIAAQTMQRGGDPRILVGIGLSIAAVSLWQMTHWTLVMTSTSFVVSGLVQGLGMGLVFMPLNAMAFAGLSMHHRTEAASLLNLSRNLGASVGISTVTALLARNSQISHSEVGAHISDSIITAGAQLLGTTGDAVMMMVDAEVNRQAGMIAYLDDFKFMMIVTMLSIPLVLILKKPAKAAKMDPAHAAMD